MSARILVVEDESIVARDLQETLEEFGYGVAAIASSGEEAIEKASQTRPDLVLMDIRLKGKLDGVDTAMRLRQQMQLPVVYLTAYADDETVERAKATEPLGYLLKPFVGREVYSAITIALERARTERKLRQGKDWLGAVLQSLGSSVLVTDAEGTLLFMNPAAEALTGWKQSDAFGRNVLEVFRLVDAHPQSGAGIPLHEVLWQRAERGFTNATLRSASGLEVPIRYSVSPIRGETEHLSGGMLILCHIEEPGWTEGAQGAHDSAQHDLVADAVERPSLVGFLSGLLAVLGVVAVGLLVWPLVIAWWIVALGGVLALAAAYGVRMAWTRLRAPFRRESQDSTASAAIDLAGTQIPRMRRERLSPQGFERARSAVWDIDILTGEVRWWDSLAPLGQMPPGALRGSIEGLFQVIHPDDRHMLNEALAAIERSTIEDPEVTLELRIILPTGDVRWVLVKGRVLYNQHGSPLRVVGVALDTSEQKESEGRSR